MTQTIRALIIDDEAPARTRIRKLLESRSGRFEIAEAVHAVSALEIIPQFKPQVLFLDVNMPQMSGFELLQQLGSLEFEVVFQTAHDEFAIKAFEVNACDYLLKPFSEERFNQALDRALARIKKSDSGSVAGSIERLMDYLPTQARHLTRLLVKAGSKTKFIDLTEVAFFESVQHITEAHLSSNISYAISLSLTDLEKQLDPAAFMRIHRNSIIRLGLVESFQSVPEFIVSLKGGRQFKVARDRQRALIDRLKT